MSTFINIIIDDNKWEYLTLYRLSEIELDKSDFRDKEVVIFKKSTIRPLMSNLKTASDRICYFGKITNE